MSSWWAKDFQSSPKRRQVLLWIFAILIAADAAFNAFLFASGLINGAFSDQAKWAGAPWLIVAQPVILITLILLEAISSVLWFRKKSDLPFLAGGICLCGTIGAITPSHPLNPDRAFIFWMQFAMSIVVIAVATWTLAMYQHESKGKGRGSSGNEDQ